jgi:hypothetical protein
MKKIINIYICAMFVLSVQSQALAQAIDEQRMTRDIEVAENVLATLIKRELGHQNTFFGMDVKGTYQPGYGVTFRLPADQSMPFVISIGGADVEGPTITSDGTGYRYSISTNGSSQEEISNDDKVVHEDGAIHLKDKVKEKKQMSSDSVRSAYNDRIIKAAKDFILDYGDFMSQLSPAEKIVVTNQNDRHHFYFNSGKRTRISVEGTRADITSLKSGKLTREQAMQKLTVVNTESVETKEPDMEMLSSIFTRLYRPDLSKTYFVEGNVYYERLRDYGAIFYMQMVSSIEKNLNRFHMPTVGLENLDQEARDKKVVELYSAFEQDVKDNILEYGRTVKSLKDNEVLVFNISLTKCKGCGIPSTLEVGIKGSVLKEFGAGKIDKSAAMSEFTLKKGVKQ